MPHLTADDADRMEKLLAGGNIAAEMDEGMSYGTLSMNNLSSSQFWNILLYTGYLTVAKRGSGRTHELRIPNEEVRSCFRYNISDYYKGKGSGEYVTLARKLIDQLLAGDAVNAAGSLRTLLRGFVSLRDNATRAPHENFYHGFLSGILAAAGDNISGFKSQLQDLASKAIAQIEEKGYASALCGDGADRVIECGIAFRGRNCAVRCKELLPR